MKRSRIETKLDLPNSVRLSELTEVSLFRILPESLTYVHRHSGSCNPAVWLNLINRLRERAQISSCYGIRNNAVRS